MSIPAFELTPKGHVFDPGDEIYVIDSNGVDLLKATIKKRLKKGYVAHHDGGEEEDLKFHNTRRLLIRTGANTAIWEAQEKLRATMPPAPDDDPEPSPRRVRRGKKPLLSPATLVQDAWRAGLRDVDAFRTTLEDAVHLFENHHRMSDIEAHPLFPLGGGLTEEEVSEFWRAAAALWRGMFKEEVAVPTAVFLKKAAHAFKLPNQDPANARETLGYYFETDEVDVATFCSFLAMFGPAPSTMRKIADFFKIDPATRDAILPVDITEVGNVAELEAIEPANSFSVNTEAGQKTVFNIVSVDNQSEYLVDSDGKKYDSWVAFVQENPPIPPPNEEED
jgi:hypothetical protein